MILLSVMYVLPEVVIDATVAVKSSVIAGRMQMMVLAVRCIGVDIACYVAVGVVSMS